MADGLPYERLKQMLQSAVQSVQWTYIIFWQICPQQQVLVWGDGCYNGPIKTRKTVQAVEVSTEEAALSRSEQLRELYDSLATGELQVTENQQQAMIRRPSVALSPEDLTESEWFYLMCVSFSFVPGVGLVGETYAKQRHVWLTGANDVDSKVFERAILAKSAHIQTVVCIPLLNGVIELGTTEKVDETIDFVELVKMFFTNKPIFPLSKPALSAHSSNTTLSSNQIPAIPIPLNNVYSVDEEEEENESDFEAETVEDIRLGSPNDGYSNLDSSLQLLATSRADSCRTGSAPQWRDQLKLHNPPTIQLHASAFEPEEEVQPDGEDTHYSRTLSIILHNQSMNPQHSTSTHNYSLHSTQSSFSTWISDHHHHPGTTTSQCLLKYMLFTQPFLHSTSKSYVNGDTSDCVASRLRKTTSHDDLSANHVLAERRRREKLNERFVILRSLVPLVTKMDKASILEDTIEYVKQLRKKIQELEARGDSSIASSEKRKILVVEVGSGGGRKAGRAVQVEVSIIESDALVELQCPHREGLLLDVMKKLREVGVEVTTVQSCVDDGTCTVEMRAKME